MVARFIIPVIAPVGANGEAGDSTDYGANPHGGGWGAPTSLHGRSERAAGLLCYRTLFRSGARCDSFLPYFFLRPPCCPVCPLASAVPPRNDQPGMPCS